MLTWLEISKSALIHNLKEFRKIIGPKIKLMAVVKSNAYGHGLIGVAQIIEKEVDYFGVANLDEALELRKNGLKKPILILTYWPIANQHEFGHEFHELEQAIRKNVEFVVYTYPQAKILSEISQKIGRIVKIHLKIDTGTSRIGLLPKDALNFALKCSKLPLLATKGVFTHFAKAEAYNQKYTLLQGQRLRKVAQVLRKEGINFDLLHAACSAAALINPQTHFDLVRLGIMTYGLWSSEETKLLAKKMKLNLSLKPALTWKTQIIQVKDLPVGTPIGYDGAYRLKKKGRIAVLPVGYWDGYDRKLSNQGEVLIRGQRAPVRGKICMNLMMVEVTKIPHLKIGDEVVLIGRQGKEKISVEEMAEKIGTINYEVVTRINPLIPRIYKKTF